MSEQRAFMHCHKQSAPTCPRCGHAMTYEEMMAVSVDLFAIAPSEEREAISCPSCNEEYWVEGGYTPHYTSALAEEELL